MPEVKLTLNDSELSELSARGRRLYEEARGAFEEGVPENEFLSRFLSGHPASPLFDNLIDRKAVLVSPLYMVFKNMWLELGVLHGAMKRSANKALRGDDLNDFLLETIRDLPKNLDMEASSSDEGLLDDDSGIRE